MKKLLCGILFLLNGLPLFAEPQPVTLVPIEWADWSRHGFGEPEDTDLSYTQIYGYILDHKGGKPLDLALFTLGPAVASKVHAAHYAVAGKIVCQGITPGSYLEATSYFAPASPGDKETVVTVRTDGKNSAQSAIEGDDAGRAVELPFTMPAGAALDHIALKLHLEGNGWIAFSDMKLVQYPDASAPAAAASTTKAEVAAGPAAKETDTVLVPLDGWRGQALGGGQTPGLDYQLEDTSSEGPNKGLQVIYSGTTPISTMLGAWGPPAQNTTGAYTLTGEVRCDEGWPGSYLQFRTLAPAPFPIVPADDGPVVDFQPDKTWHSFSLTTDRRQVADKIREIRPYLCLAGPCTLHLRNFKLQEGPAPAPLAADEPGTVAEFRWDNFADWTNYALPSHGALIWALQYPKLTATHFAIVGEAFYDKAVNRHLWIVGTFLPEKPDDPPVNLISRSDAASSPLAKFDGSSGWRPFAMPFDASAVKTRITQLVLMMNDGGGNDGQKIYLRNVRLVEYPNGFPAEWGTVPLPIDATKNAPTPSTVSGSIPAPQAAPASNEPPALAAQSRPTLIDWKSFLLGVAATVVVIAAAVSFSFLRRRLKHRAHERELRRIASIDS